MSSKAKTTPKKIAATPKKKVATPVKKVTTPVKKVATPVKKVATPVKKVATPKKKPTTPVKSPKKKSLKIFPLDQGKLLELTSDFKKEMEDLEKEEDNQKFQKFSQEASFSSVSKDGHTKTVNSLKASISLPDPEKTKQMCEKISEKDPNIECVYNEKENTCYIDGTSIVNKTFDALKDKFGFNQGPETDKLKELLNENILPHQTSLIPTMTAGPLKRPLSAPKIIFIRKPMLSPNMGHFSGAPFMGGGGCSLGKTNGCPDNGRLIYDAEGKIGCGNMSNQGGQKFMYPKTINNFVGGKKKSLKKKKQRGGEEGDRYKLENTIKQEDYEFLEPLDLSRFIEEASFVEHFRDEQKNEIYLKGIFPNNTLYYINKEKYPNANMIGGSLVLLNPKDEGYYDFPPYFIFKEKDLIQIPKQ